MSGAWTETFQSASLPSMSLPAALQGKPLLLYIDHFRIDIINGQEYYIIPDMLAKSVGRSVGIIVKQQRNGFGSSDFAAAEVRKQGRVTGDPSAHNRPATQVLV